MATLEFAVTARFSLIGRARLAAIRACVWLLNLLLHNLDRHVLIERGKAK